MSPTSYQTAPPRVGAEQSSAAAETGQQSRCGVTPRPYAVRTVRVAVIDMGSNSTRLLVADVTDGRLVEVERLLEITRLAAGVDTRRLLSYAATNRTEKVVGRYVARARALDADAILAVATSAVRDSGNGADFLDTLMREHGIDARILTGEQEAAATFRGVTSARPTADDTMAVIDVGGGSTEVVIGRDGAVRAAVSLQLGCVRATERWLAEDAVDADALTAARGAIDRVLDEHLPAAIHADLDGFPLAVAGTATTLAALDLGLSAYDAERIDGHQVDRDAIAGWIVRLAPLDREERRARHPVIEAGRSPVLIGGCLVLLAVLDALDVDAFEASERDILHGIALQLAG